MRKLRFQKKAYNHRREKKNQRELKSKSRIYYCDFQRKKTLKHFISTNSLSISLKKKIQDPTTTILLHIEFLFFFIFQYFWGVTNNMSEI